VTDPDAAPPEATAGPTLAERQQALVQALVANGPAPEGLDAERLAATARGLLRKRSRVVAHVWPSLRAVDDFEEQFVAWARGRAPQSPVIEGEEFAAMLGPRLPLAVAVALVAARRRRWLSVDGWVVLRLLGAVRIVRTSRQRDVPP
jgi:hypothetical protein